jgi:protein-tyrosine-phosphatase
MEQRHKSAVVSRCPECADRTIVWNISDPYFMPADDALKVYGQIKDRVKELASAAQP